jgi:hypothetical protein
MVKILEQEEDDKTTYVVYIGVATLQKFDTYVEALAFKRSYEQLIERASIADDEQP